MKTPTSEAGRRPDYGGNRVRQCADSEIVSYILRRRRSTSTTIYCASRLRPSTAHEHVLTSGADAGRGRTTPSALNFAIFLIILGLSPAEQSLQASGLLLASLDYTNTLSHFIHFFFQHCIYFFHHNYHPISTISPTSNPTLKTSFKSQSKS